MPKKIVVESEQVQRIKAAQTLEELKAALSGTAPLEVTAEDVQAAIDRIVRA